MKRINITGVSLVSGVNYYAGTEQQFDPSSDDYTDADSPMLFSSSGAYLLELNNTALSSFPFVCWATYRGTESDGQEIWEFNQPPQAKTASYAYPFLDGGLSLTTSDTWYEVLSWDLPQAGIFLLLATITGQLLPDAGGSIVCGLSTTSDGTGFFDEQFPVVVSWGTGATGITGNRTIMYVADISTATNYYLVAQVQGTFTSATILAYPQQSWSQIA